MSYEKTILCLANSRKNSGRCIAGKEKLGDGYGEWVRPVSARPSEEISEEERRYEDGRSPKVMEIISVPMAEPKPHLHQIENHLINDEYYWERIGIVNWTDLDGALDDVVGPLWFNGSSSSNGSNDEVPEGELPGIASSLCLVRPGDLRIGVAREGGVFGPAKRKVRASFSLNQLLYRLVVTDPEIEKAYLAGNDGTYPVEDAILCISLGEVFNGKAYKLVAAVITPDTGT